MTDAVPHYKKPDWFTKHVFNVVVAAFTRLGLSVWGSRVLETTGRTSGLPRRTPVNLLTVDGTQYLLAPRGETHWVRNIRITGNGTLVIGRRRQPIQVEELADIEKPDILRAYLKRWKAEVGVFFDGVSADSAPEELDRIAPRHPIFRITGG